MQARQLRAPRQPGGLVAEPALAEVDALLARNRERLAAAAGDVAGQSFAELCRQARQEVVTLARAYFQRSGEPIPPLPATDSLLLAGHQPELFHPGVWIKNFVLNGLARAHGVTPVNLVVDNDTVKSTALKLPGWEDEHRDPASTRRLTIPFDRVTSGVPYEERRILDQPEFLRLADRAAAITGTWDFKPMLPEFWQEVQAQASDLIGERFAAARRALERRWGCHNLEVPLSAVCRGASFARFALHLLTNLPALHQAYNTSVHEYRATYGIRSRAHPVPDLAAEGDWLEAPLWAWNSMSPTRGRLFARRGARGIELRVGSERWPDLPLDPEAAVEQWRVLDEQGYKVRSRALTTTLFARLFLGDLFIHGIGGAKYDELTDEIARRFFGFEPPAYLVLSATLLLPFEAYPSHPDDCRRLTRELRDRQWNPQRHLGSNGAVPPDARMLAERKQHRIAEVPATRRGRRERYRDLLQLTEDLRPFVDSDVAALEQRWNRCRDEVEANAILRRRDYAFCLYPEAMLREYFQPFLE